MAPRLDDDFEQLAAIVVEIEQIAGENQMAGRGDRQEFGQPFDDAENQGFEEKNRIHAVHCLYREAAFYYPGAVRASRSASQRKACSRDTPHISAEGRRPAQQAGRPGWPKMSAAQGGIEVAASHARRFSQRSDGRRDAAGAAVRSAVHGFSFGYRRGAIFAHFGGSTAPRRRRGPDSSTLGVRQSSEGVPWNGATAKLAA